jgi:hypothetical protein
VAKTAELASGTRSQLGGERDTLARVGDKHYVGEQILSHMGGSPGENWKALWLPAPARLNLLIDGESFAGRTGQV